MSESAAHIILAALALYMGAGIVVAVLMLAGGIGRVDPTAHGSPLGFRLIVTPGVIALWPWALWRWARSSGAQRGGSHDA